MKQKLKLFFFIYDSRSGSTFFANNLVKTLGVLILPQTNFIPRIIDANKSIFFSKKNLIDFLFQEKKFHDLKIKKKELSDNLTNIKSRKIIILEILNYFYQKNNGSYNFIGIKKGSYVKYIDKIMEFFPESKIFCIVRDGRAIYNSKKNAYYSQEKKFFVSNPYEAAITWNKKINIMLRTQDKYNGIIIKYEDIVNNLNESIKIIIKKLSLKIYKKKNNKKYLISKRNHKNLHVNINKPPQIQNINKWKIKLSENEISCFELIAKKNLVKFNYQIYKKNFFIKSCVFTFVYALSFYVKKILNRIEN